MKVSVVMATYNGEAYLFEQMESIRKQTRPADEVIFMDDGSTDATVELVEDYIKSQQLSGSWYIERNPVNLGYANNFKKTVDQATGDYIFLADQDDIWRKDKLEKMISVMEKETECQVLCSEYVPFQTDSDAPAIPKEVYKNIKNDGSLEKIVLDKKNMNLKTLGCCMCLRKSFRDDINAYWFDRWPQDDRYWRMALCMDGCYMVHSVFVKHRIHGNNTSTYGKYHSLEKRIRLFEEKQDANLQMIGYLNAKKAQKATIKLMNKEIKMMDLRISLLKKRKLWNAIPLIMYLPYYQKLRSYILEIYMAMLRK